MEQVSKAEVERLAIKFGPDSAASKVLEYSKKFKKPVFLRSLVTIFAIEDDQLPKPINTDV